jgi:hypothetical protein
LPVWGVDVIILSAVADFGLILCVEDG